MKSHCTTSASAELLPPKHLTSHCSPSRSASEESPARGPTDVERSSICYQKHKSLPATSFLSPISQLLSKSSEHLCDAQGQGQGQAQTQTQTQAQAKPESAPAAAPTQSAPTPSNGPKRITFSGSLTPTNLSPDHSAQVKRGGSGKRGGGGGGGGGGGTLLKRMSGSIRRSQSANAHKDLPSVAQKLRERAEAFRAAAAQLDGERERIEEEGEAPTFDDETTATAAELYSTLNEKNKKRSTITGVIQNLIFLRKTTPESVETRLDKLLKQQKLPLDTLLLWGRSLDALLNDKYGLQLFRGFLRTEFSDENIEFWIECENYKNIPERKLCAKAQKIYDDYIAVQAPREVNLDSKTRLHTIAAMSCPNQLTFELAQRRIQSLMEKDSYQRFLRSELYCSLLRQAREESQVQTSSFKTSNSNSNSNSN